MPRFSNRTRRSAPQALKLLVERLEDRCVPSTWHFDFGTPTSPADSGCIGVPVVGYAVAQGYGWQGISAVSAVDRWVGDPLTRDFHQAHQATFLADVTNGTYQVTLHLGDVKGIRDSVDVSAEGAFVGQAPLTGSSEVINASFLVQVADGQLALQLTDSGPDNAKFALAGINIVAADSSSAAFDGDFNGTDLGAGWVTNSWAWNGGGPLSLSTANSLLTFAGGELRSAQTFSNIGVEGQVSFAAAPWQHFGMATDLDSALGNYWAMFSTAGSTGRLYARVNANGTSQDVDIGPLPMGLHGYRVNPIPGAFEFYVDGVLKTIINVAIPSYVPLRAMASAFNASPSMQLDWARLRSPTLFRDDFNGMTLSPGWETSAVNYAVANSLLTFSGGQVRSLATFNNAAVEGRISFGSAPWQHFGVATNLDTVVGNSWAIFSTAASSNRLYARVNANGNTQDVDLGVLSSDFHNYRIQPTSTGVAFYIDGALTTTINTTIARSALLRITSSTFSDPPMQVDWIYLDPANSPLLADAGADQSGLEGTPVRFGGTATGGAGPYSYSWNFGDGASASRSAAPWHAYADNGRYTVILTITDSSGAIASARVTITIANVPPTPTVRERYTGTAGRAIYFSGSATDPSSADTAAGFSYLWNFGDGATSTLQNPSHVYAAAGSYTVTLSVTDKDGATGSATTRASVSAVDGLLPLVYADNVQYLGAFRVPSGQFGASVFDYGGTALAFNPAGNSLFLVGHDWDQKVAEISIPQSVMNSNQLGGLPTASVLQPFVDVLGRVPNSTLAGRHLKIGGLMVANGQLIGTAYDYYDGLGTAVTSHFKLDSLNLSTGVTGFFQVGALGGGFVGGYMAAVPPEWQNALGAAYVTGQAALPIIGRTSSGPAAFGFDPKDLGLLPARAIPYVYYPINYQLGPMAGAPSLLFNGTTSIDGVFFAPQTRSVLFFGSNGTSEIGYGEAGTFNDPYRLSKGYHAVNGAYQYQVWAYSVDDLFDVSKGFKQPWQIKPYTVWNLDFPIFDGAKRIGGVAYDPGQGRLYVSQLAGDVVGYGCKPLIHVFQLSFNRPGSPTLTAPRIGWLTSSPNSPSVGSNVTLAAGDVRATNVGGTVVEVAFYLDSNRDDSLEPGTDTLLGYGTRSGDTWSLTFSTNGLYQDTYTISARAKDDAGIFSDPFTTTITLG